MFKCLMYVDDCRLFDINLFIICNIGVWVSEYRGIFNYI